MIKDEIEIPLLYQPLYKCFLELKSQDIENRISHQALINYQKLFNIKFYKFEIDAFKCLDLIFDRILTKRRK